MRPSTVPGRRVDLVQGPFSLGTDFVSQQICSFEDEVSELGYSSPTLSGDLDV